MEKLVTVIGIRLALVLGGVERPSLRRQEGQTFVEYAMILAIVGIAVAAVLASGLKSKLVTAYNNIANAI
jgi:Flp pilus assembly pilin Flp